MSLGLSICSPSARAVAHTLSVLVTNMCPWPRILQVEGGSPALGAISPASWTLAFPGHLHAKPRSEGLIGEGSQDSPDPYSHPLSGCMCSYLSGPGQGTVPLG